MGGGDGGGGHTLEGCWPGQNGGRGAAERLVWMECVLPASRQAREQPLEGARLNAVIVSKVTLVPFRFCQNFKGL